MKLKRIINIPNIYVVKKELMQKRMRLILNRQSIFLHIQAFKSSNIYNW